MEKLIESKTSSRLAVVKFEVSHVERHPAVAQVLGVYKED
jgi:hypothetical protein